MLRRNPGVRLRHTVARGLKSMVVSVVVLGLLAPYGIAGAQDAPISMFPRSVDHNLAAMVLTLDEYPVEGLWSDSGRLTSIEYEAALMQGSIGVDSSVIIQALDDAGWQGRYVSYVGLTSSDDPQKVSMRGGSYVAEYKDDEGAGIGFALMEEEAVASAVDIDAPEVGDESELTRTEGTDEVSGEPFVELDYTFRVDHLVAGIGLTWYGDAVDDALDADEMAETAETLLGRIESVVDDDNPSLFSRTLRLESGNHAAIDDSLESYLYNDGVYYPQYWETAQNAESTVDFYVESGVESSYRHESFPIPVSAGPDDLSGAYVVRLYDLGQRRDAREFVPAGMTFFMETAEADGYSNLEPMTDVPGLDGEFAGLSYTFTIEPGLEVSGYRVWYQVGDVVVGMQVDGPNGVDPQVLFALLAEQVDCLDSQRFCRPIDVPEGLVG